MTESTLTARDLAEVLCVCVRQVRRMDAAELLPEPIRMGRLVRWRESDIADWLAAGCPDRRRWELMQPQRKAVKA